MVPISLLLIQLPTFINRIWNWLSAQCPFVFIILICTYFILMARDVVCVVSSIVLFGIYEELLQMSARHPSVFHCYQHLRNDCLTIQKTEK